MKDTRKSVEDKNVLISDPKEIGNRLLKIRKSKGLSQEDVAWAAGLSSRTYADIERGTVNARLDSVIRICKVFGITPNDILTSEDYDSLDEKQIIANLVELPPAKHETALRLLQIYIRSCME